MAFDVVEKPGRPILSFDLLGAIFLLLLVGSLFVIAVVGVSFPDAVMGQTINRVSIFLFVVALLGIIRNAVTRASLLRRLETRGAAAAEAAKSFKDSLSRLGELRKD